MVADTDDALGEDREHTRLYEPYQVAAEMVKTLEVLANDDCAAMLMPQQAQQPMGLPDIASPVHHHALIEREVTPPGIEARKDVYINMV